MKEFNCAKVLVEAYKNDKPNVEVLKQYYRKCNNICYYSYNGSGKAWSIFDLAEITTNDSEVDGIAILFKLDIYNDLLPGILIEIFEQGIVTMTDKAEIEEFESLLLMDKIIQ